MDLSTVIFFIIVIILVLIIIGLVIYANSINVSPSSSTSYILISVLNAGYLIPREGISSPGLYVNGSTTPYPEPTIYWSITPGTTKGTVTIENLFLGAYVQVTSSMPGQMVVLVSGTIVNSSTQFILTPATSAGLNAYTISYAAMPSLYLNAQSSTGFVGLSTTPSIFLINA